MVLILPLNKNNAEPLEPSIKNVIIRNNVRDYFPHPYSMEDADFFFYSKQRLKPNTHFRDLIEQ